MGLGVPVIIGGFIVIQTGNDMWYCDDCYDNISGDVKLEDVEWKQPKIHITLPESEVKLIDMFAIEAMNIIIKYHKYSYEDVAMNAYNMAEEMMRERKRRGIGE